MALAVGTVLGLFGLVSLLGPLGIVARGEFAQLEPADWWLSVVAAGLRNALLIASALAAIHWPPVSGMLAWVAVLIYGVGAGLMVKRTHGALTVRNFQPVFFWTLSALAVGAAMLTYSTTSVA